MFMKRPLVLAFAIEPVELLLEHLEGVVDREPLPHEHRKVVDLRGVGHRHHRLARPGFNQVRLVVVQTGR